jgi:hypothetical protein
MHKACTCGEKRDGTNSGTSTRWSDSIGGVGPEADSTEVVRLLLEAKASPDSQTLVSSSTAAVPLCDIQIVWKNALAEFC